MYPRSQQSPETQDLLAIRQKAWHARACHGGGKIKFGIQHTAAVKDMHCSTGQGCSIGIQKATLRPGTKQAQTQAQLPFEATNVDVALHTYLRTAQHWHKVARGISRAIPVLLGAQRLSHYKHKTLVDCRIGGKTRTARAQWKRDLRLQERSSR